VTIERRVLFVTPYYPPAHLGGIERAIERLALALRQARPTLAATVLTTHYRFPPAYVAGLPARELRPEAAVERWSSRPHTPLPLFPAYSCPVTWFGPAELRRILRAVRPDIIHMVGDGWAWAHLALLALRPTGAAIVFTPSFHRMTPARQWLRLPNRLLCARADATIVLTDQEREDIQRVYHAPAPRLHVIPWGVDVPGDPISPVRGLGAASPPEFASPACALPPDRDEPVRILCVGRMGQHKGQRWLLETYAQARAAFRQPARLVFVGKDEGDERALRAEIERLQLRGEVELLGEVSDAALQQEYARADAFALFSRFEAFGLVFLEAMAQGVPVLTHRLGAGPRLLTAGAVLTAPFARAEAVRELARLVNDDAWRTHLARQAQRFVAGRFSWERCATSTLLAYDQALARRTRRGAGSAV
jgi:glycosyltransferase involved in cell wall biosynthesis